MSPPKLNTWSRGLAITSIVAAVGALVGVLAVVAFVIRR